MSDDRLLAPSIFYTSGDYVQPTLDFDDKRWKIEYFMKIQKKVLASRPRQLLNGREVLRIPALKIYIDKVEIRFGSWNVGSTSGRGTEVCKARTEKATGGCMLFAGSEMKRRKSSLFWRQGKKV